MNKKAWNKIGRITIFSIVILFILIMGFIVAEDWPMFMHDANHTGYSGDSVNMTNFGLLWKSAIGNQLKISPSISNGVVYSAGSDNKTFALNTTNGDYIWNYTTGGDIKGSPSISNGVLYIGSDDKNIYALNATNGSQIWNYTTTSAILDSPNILNDIVYFPAGYKNKIYALNATNGSQIWNYTTSGFIFNSPAVVEDIVYIGDDNFYIYALNATNGSQIWNYTTGDKIRSSPAISNGKVYVGSLDNNIYALNATNGSQIWNYSTDREISSSPSVMGDIVYLGSDDKNIYALNATNGSKIWNYSTGGNVKSSSPAISSNGILFIGSTDKNIYALNVTTGEYLWNYATEGNISISPAISNGVVYIGSDDYNLYAFTNGYCTTPTDDLSITSDTTLCSGTYYLNDSSNDGLIIFNSNHTTLTCDGTILIGNNSGRGIYSSGNNNITVKNCEVRDYNNNLELDETSNSLVENNTIFNAAGYGILTNIGAPNCDNLTIISNNFTGNPYGIVIMDTKNSNMSYNYFYNNTIADLDLIAYARNSTENIISYNNFIGTSPDGIVIYANGGYYTKNTTIFNNNVSDVIGMAIYTYPNTTNNLIYNNIFSSTTPAYDNGTLNSWNTTNAAGTNILGGTELGGNYYSDYSTADTDGDGIGSTAYTIPGTATSIDYLPLTTPYTTPVTQTSSSCFPGYTLISMKDNSQKQIKDVKVNEEVLSYDAKNKKYTFAKVLELESPIREGFYSINNLINVTDEHPFYIKKDNKIGWGAINALHAKQDSEIQEEILDLEIGDFIFNGNWLEVESIKYFPGPIQTYNLKVVDKYNNFFANNFLVHNKGGTPTTPEDPPIICETDCTNKECGSDGCDGTCGTCDTGIQCSSGVCVEECQPECENKQCGSGNCGGNCGTCEDNEQCYNNQCSEKIIPIELECEPDWECSEWGECEVIYKVEEVLTEEISLNGTSRRICTDKNNCANDMMESTQCQISEDITVNKTIWCFEECFEMFEEDTGDFIGRIKDLQEAGNALQSLDLSFSEDASEEECPYCFRETFDEETLDLDNWKVWKTVAGGETSSSIEGGQYKTSVVGEGDYVHWWTLQRTDKNYSGANEYASTHNTWEGLKLKQKVLDDFKAEIDFADLEQTGHSGAWRFEVTFQDNQTSIRAEFAINIPMGIYSQVHNRINLAPNVTNYMDKTLRKSAQKLIIERKGNNLSFYVDDVKFHEMRNFTHLPRVGEIGFAPDVQFGGNLASVSVNEFSLEGGCYNNPCGDGIVGVGEQCDGGDLCNEDCTNDVSVPKPACRDGIDNDKDGFIDLKDGGCSNYIDNNETNEVILLCGNGELNLEGGEECDDGNLENLDGCDSECLIENYCFVSTFDQEDGQYFNSKRGGNNPTTNGWWLWGYRAPKNIFEDGKYKIDLHGVGEGFEEYGYDGLVGLRKNNLAAYNRIMQNASSIDGLQATNKYWLKDDFEIEFAFSNFSDYGETKFYKPGVKFSVRFKDNFKYVRATMHMYQTGFQIYHTKDLSGNVNNGGTQIEYSSDYHVMNIKRQGNKLIYSLDGEEIYETEFKDLPEVGQPLIWMDTHFKDVNGKVDFEYFVVKDGCYNSFCGDNILTKLASHHNEECDNSTNEACSLECKLIPTPGQCSNGIDEDEDHTCDWNGCIINGIEYAPDQSCEGPDDEDERNPLAICEDGEDNDKDLFIDYGEGGDLGCVNSQDMTEEGGDCDDDTCITISACGNDRLDPDEQCEDGNLADGDGCSSKCIIEEVLLSPSEGSSEGGSSSGGTIEKIFDLIPFIKKAEKMEQITDYEDSAPIKRPEKEKKNYWWIIILFALIVGILVLLIIKRRPIIRVISFNRKKEKSIEKRLKKLFSD